MRQASPFFVCELSSAVKNMNENDAHFNQRVRLTFLTLFPEMIEAPLRASLMGKAAEKNKVEFSVVQIRDFATDNINL